MSSTTVHLVIADPDDPYGMPAYDGPLHDIGRHLEPGAYTGTATFTAPSTIPGAVGDDYEVPVTVTVTVRPDGTAQLA